MNRSHWAAAAMLLLTAAACDDSKSSSGTDPSTTSTPPTFCEAANTANAASQLPQQLFNTTTPPPPVAVQAVVEEFADRFAEMAALAPADVKSDVDTLDAAAQQLLSVVRASNYDVSKMTTTPEFTALGATFSSADYQNAQRRFLAYIDANCATAPTTTTTVP